MVVAVASMKGGPSVVPSPLDSRYAYQMNQDWTTERAHPIAKSSESSLRCRYELPNDSHTIPKMTNSLSVNAPILSQHLHPPHHAYHANEDHKMSSAM